MILLIAVLSHRSGKAYGEAEAFQGECTFSQSPNAVDRECSIDASNTCITSIVETQSSKANDRRCGEALKTLGISKSSFAKTGMCVLDNGILAECGGTPSACCLMPTNACLFNGTFNCNTLNNKLYNKNLAVNVVSDIKEDKALGRCAITFKPDVPEKDMRAYLEFLGASARCGGCGSG